MQVRERRTILSRRHSWSCYRPEVMLQCCAGPVRGSTAQA